MALKNHVYEYCLCKVDNGLILQVIASDNIIAKGEESAKKLVFIRHASELLAIEEAGKDSKLFLRAF